MISLKLTALCFVCNIFVVGAHYNKAFIEDLCNFDGVWNLGSGNSNSSGILRTSRDKVFLENKNCTIIIQPPLGYGVILSVRLIDFRPYYPPYCENFIEVPGQSKALSLCGYSDDLSEYQSYFTEGKPMKLKFVTTNKTGAEYRSNVFFVATSFVKFSYSCEQKMFKCENSRCIWKGLTCDSHNNCGDQSDEFSRRNANCGQMSAGVIAAIVVGSVATFIIFIIIPFICCRCCSKKSERDPPLIQPDTAYRPPQSMSREQPEESQRASSSNGRYRDLPPAYKP